MDFGVWLGVFVCFALVVCSCGSAGSLVWVCWLFGGSLTVGDWIVLLLISLVGCVADGYVLRC